MFLLNIDPKYANQQLRTSLVLPNGTGKELKIAVFTEPDYVDEALKAGANIVGSDDLLEEMSNGNLDFDLLITNSSINAKTCKIRSCFRTERINAFTKIRNCYPRFKSSINEFKKGKLEYRADKTGIVHLGFGKVTFTEEQLEENLLAVYEFN